MICPGCQQERSSLAPSAFGFRCRECRKDDIVPSFRTDIRMALSIFAAFFLLVLFPPLFLLWTPFAVFATFRWAPSNRRPALGGFALLVAFWAGLVPQMVAWSKTSPYIEGSTGGGLVALVFAFFLLFYLRRPMRAVVFELMFRGRGMAAGLLQSGTLVAIAGTFLLALVLLL